MADDEPPADGVIPAPNAGGLAEPEPPDERPAVSPRAEAIGIEYCLPAGEPGSTCTPEDGPPEASAAGGAQAQSAAKIPPTKMRMGSG